MMMKTYWDLDEDARGALTEADVERYVDAELMLKGVLRAKPPPLANETAMPEPARSVYVVQSAGRHYNGMEIAFESRESAHAFIALCPMSIGSHYLDGDSLKFTEPRADLEVVERKLFTKVEADVVLVQAKRADASEKASKAARLAYAEAIETQNKALEGLWADWHACRALVAKREAIRATFAEYEKIAGARDVAASFLAKVYSDDEIRGAIQGLSPEAAQ